MTKRKKYHLKSTSEHLQCYRYNECKCIVIFGGEFEHSTHQEIVVLDLNYYFKDHSQEQIVDMLKNLFNQISKAGARPLQSP